MMMPCQLPTTTHRVADHTCNQVNQDIRNKTIQTIDSLKDSTPDVLNDQIHKLDVEWDTERVLEATAASAILLGSVLGYTKKQNCWFLMTGAAGAFLMQHALQGWCPPLPVIRKMGVRTAEEITHEKTAFKHIRGDFAAMTKDANELMTMAEK